MKRIIFRAGGLVFASLFLCIYACKKDNTSSSIDAAKNIIVAGNWQQTDIQLAAGDLYGEHTDVCCRPQRNKAII